MLYNVLSIFALKHFLKAIKATGCLSHDVKIMLNYVLSVKKNVPRSDDSTSVFAPTLSDHSVLQVHIGSNVSCVLGWET